MPAQYDTLAGPYGELRKTTVSIVEHVNVRKLVLPLIQGAAVLDLACGTGPYSRSFLEWGAKKVVGVDISSGMVDGARALSQNQGGNIEFIVADGSTPREFPGAPFDLAFGAWFLNYAEDYKQLVVYFKNILLNLREGGRFVGVTPPPTNDPRKFIEDEQVLRPLPTASGGLYSTVNHDVTDGVSMHLYKDTTVGNLDFDCYHLRKDIWEAAAREAGFRGELKWSHMHVPDDFMQDPKKHGEESNGGAGEEELETYKTLPHFGLLYVER